MFLIIFLNESLFYYFYYYHSRGFTAIMNAIIKKQNINVENILSALT